MPQPLAIALALLCACLPAAAAARSPATPPGAVTSTPELRFPPRPIVSRAQLDIYLRRTPGSASPLQALTTGGKRRFLASLVFGDRGLGGFATDDLRYDLTGKQVWNVLRLFGAQDHAAGLPARTRPRPAPRQPATLEEAYERLVAGEGAGGQTAIYARAFAPAQSHVSALGDRDLELSFRAAARMQFAAPSSAAYLADLRRDFAELEARRLADRPHADALYRALLGAHRTDDARRVLASYPSLERQPSPTLRVASDVRDNQASVWVARGQRELWRLPLMLHDDAQVIVLGSASCHFSNAAARSIDADPALREVFGKHAQWIAPAHDIADLDALLAWNAQHPAQRLAIANEDAQLPFVTRPETPVFYFLRHGELVDTVVGWPGARQREALRQGLRDIGLLP